MDTRRCRAAADIADAAAQTPDEPSGEVDALSPQPAGHLWTAVEPEPIDTVRDLPSVTDEPVPPPLEGLSQPSGAAPTSNGHGHHDPTAPTHG